MKNKVFYGEYTLKHWVDLIESKNLILPEYQRTLAWKPDQVKHLIDSFSKDYFVPPVTIASINNGQSTKNYIIDGQQRLTSLILFKANIYPDKNFFKGDTNVTEEEVNDLQSLQSESSSDTTSPNTGNSKATTKLGRVRLNWTINDYLNDINNLDHYETLAENPVSDRLKFLESHYLGFAYIVPLVQDFQQQQKYFSTIFRDINSQGVGLTSIERRRSLYFLNKKHKDLFDSNVLKHFQIVDGLGNARDLDWIRYLAILSQYKKDGNSTNIARGFRSTKKREDYYIKYITAVVDTEPLHERISSLESKSDKTDNEEQQLSELKNKYNEQTEIFCDFYSIFPDGKYSDRLTKIEDAIKNNISSGIFPKEFCDIMLADLYLFGIIYHTFMNDKVCILPEDFQAIIETEKSNLTAIEGARRSPNDIARIKERLDKSIEIYNRYIEAD